MEDHVNIGKTALHLFPEEFVRPGKVGIRKNADGDHEKLALNQKKINIAR